MTFTTPPLDPTRKALLRDFLVAEVARTPVAGPPEVAAEDADLSDLDLWSGDGNGSGSLPARSRYWVPALVAAAAAAVVTVGIVAAGGAGPSPAGPAAPQPSSDPQETAANGAVRVLGADELEALGAGRSGYGFAAECMRAHGWNATYHSHDESVEGSLAADAQGRWDADWRLCRAAAAVGLRSTGDVTDEVWAALYAHAQEVARCSEAVGVPVAPLPSPDRFAQVYGSMQEWVAYPGDPDLLTAEQIAVLDRCASAP